MNETVISQRLDKWLWHARFAKTRTLAQKLVTGGKIRINREKTTNPSRQVKPGEFLTLALPRQVKIVEILDIAQKRGPFSEARLLYNDHTPIEEKKQEEECGAFSTSSIQKDKCPDRDSRRTAIRMKQNFPGN